MAEKSIKRNVSGDVREFAQLPMIERFRKLNEQANAAGGQDFDTGIALDLAKAGAGDAEISVQYAAAILMNGLAKKYPGLRPSIRPLADELAGSFNSKIAGLAEETLMLCTDGDTEAENGALTTASL